MNGLPKDQRRHSPPAGDEWIIDAFSCDPELLRSVVVLRAVCDEIVRGLQLNVIGTPVWHQFPGAAGVTGMYLLSESHLACHTYPEHGLSTFNLYCCRPKPIWPWQQHLQVALGASEVRVRRISRGGMRRDIETSPPRDWAEMRDSSTTHRIGTETEA